MSHLPIKLQGVGLSFPHKTCFEGLSATLQHGSRIALVGRNGSGKSSLLQMLRGQMLPSEGSVTVPDDVLLGYVPQTVKDFDICSGGERFHKALTQALRLQPNLLLLDEPTNHLDRRRRQSLMRMLSNYPHTLIVATHDVELLNTCIDTLWHIDQGRVHIFSGTYDNYMREIGFKRASIERELSDLHKQKRDAHQSLMMEQDRAKKSDQRGQKSIQNRKWPTIVSDEKARRAIETSGKKKRELRDQREDAAERLGDLRLPEVIVPKFSLQVGRVADEILVSISDGVVGYSGQPPLLNNIHFFLGSKERLALVGDNGSGKTTFLKALLNDPSIQRTGDWHVPKDIGYLDQHYGTLNEEQSVLDHMTQLAPTMHHADMRKHLNDFLFRKNEEVNAKVATLSGGEKARLSLACIALTSSQLLLLDEITNNVDLETREHIIQVLRHYPGAMMVVSHDDSFLKAIEIEKKVDVADFQ